jgi:SAM-dependent methyltransferase
MDRDPTTRFSSRAGDYARYRPLYPPQLVGVIAEETGLTPDWVVADVGSGTGRSAQPFLDNGNTVFGVEPDAAMRRAAEALLHDRTAFRSVAGRAESTGLDAGSVDLVVAGQAFHWFDASRARIEFRRILRPPGPVVLLWNTRQTSSTPFLRAYESLLLAYGTDYARVRHDRRGAEVLESFFDGAYRRRVLPNEQALDLAAVRGRLASTSYVPGRGEPGHEPMMARLGEIVEAHAVEGIVHMIYDLEVYCGRVGAGG